MDPTQDPEAGGGCCPPHGYSTIAAVASRQAVSKTPAWLIQQLVFGGWYPGETGDPASPQRPGFTAPEDALAGSAGGDSAAAHKNHLEAYEVHDRLAGMIRRGDAPGGDRLAEAHERAAATQRRAAAAHGGTPQ